MFIIVNQSKLCRLTQEFHSNWTNYQAKKVTAKPCAYFDSRSVEIVNIVWKEAQSYIHSNLSKVGNILTTIQIHNMTVTKFRVETMLSEIRCSFLFLWVNIQHIYDLRLDSICRYTGWAYLIFVIFLHEQNFWIIKFTPKNANFSR